MVVHILATVRKAKLLEAALLSFRTLRVGFPRAEVWVWGNDLDWVSAAAVEGAARGAGGRFVNGKETSHDAWLQELICRGAEPFWVADTDLVFWEAVEGWGFEAPVAGRLEPGFHEPWTGTFHMERLHTCLMRIDPVALRMALRGKMARVPEPFGFTATWPFVRQTFIPRKLESGKQKAEIWFYDTCAGIWQAGIGEAFTEARDAAFDHLHCATYADEIGPSLDVPDLAGTHRAIYEDLRLARGIRAGQDAYYARRAGREEARAGSVNL